MPPGRSSPRFIDQEQRAITGRRYIDIAVSIPIPVLVPELGSTAAVELVSTALVRHVMHLISFGRAMAKDVLTTDLRHG
jgi:bacteriorhodopsin